MQVLGVELGSCRVSKLSYLTHPPSPFLRVLQLVPAGYAHFSVPMTVDDTAAARMNSVALCGYDCWDCYLCQMQEKLQPSTFWKKKRKKMKYLLSLPSEADPAMMLATSSSLWGASHPHRLCRQLMASASHCAGGFICIALVPITHNPLLAELRRMMFIWLLKFREVK